MSRFIDLSVAIESGLPSDPPMMIPKIMYIDHALGARATCRAGSAGRSSSWRSRRMQARIWTRLGTFIPHRIKGSRP